MQPIPMSFGRWSVGKAGIGALGRWESGHWSIGALERWGKNKTQKS